MSEGFRALEGRLARIESVIASDECELSRKFRDMEG